MRLTPALAALVALVLLSALSTAAPPGDCHVLVLKETDSGPKLVSVPVASGQPTILKRDEIITVVAPFGLGLSGDLIHPEDRVGTFSVECSKDELKIAIVSPDGSERELPAVKRSELRDLDMRISVTTGSGDKRSFLVRGYDWVSRVGGPVIDMFGGSEELQPGDYSVTTEVTKGEPMASPAGEAALELRDDTLYVRGTIPGAGSGLFILDTGASGSAVLGSMVPPGVDVSKVVAVEHSAEGSRVLPGTMSAAGGDVSGFAGAAVLPELDIGGVVVPEAHVNVIESMGDLEDPGVVGVLGLDILRRAGVATLSFDAPGGPALVLGQISRLKGREGVIEIPLSVAADLVFLGGTLAGRPVTFLLDAGARATLVPKALSDAVGLKPSGGEKRTFRGLDQAKLEGGPVRLDGLILAGWNVPTLDAYAVELPVLSRFGLDETGGLLGIDFVTRFAAVELDFPAGVLRLKPR